MDVKNDGDGQKLESKTQHANAAATDAEKQLLDILPSGHEYTFIKTKVVIKSDGDMAISGAFTVELTDLALWKEKFEKRNNLRYTSRTSHHRSILKLYWMCAHRQQMNIDCPSFMEVEAPHYRKTQPFNCAVTFNFRHDHPVHWCSKRSIEKDMPNEERKSISRDGNVVDNNELLLGHLPDGYKYTIKDFKIVQQDDGQRSFRGRFRVDLDDIARWKSKFEIKHNLEYNIVKTTPSHRGYSTVSCWNCSQKESGCISFVEIESSKSSLQCNVIFNFYHNHPVTFCTECPTEEVIQKFVSLYEKGLTPSEASSEYMKDAVDTEDSDDVLMDKSLCPGISWVKQFFLSKDCEAKTTDPDDEEFCVVDEICDDELVDEVNTKNVNGLSDNIEKALDEMLSDLRDRLKRKPELKSDVLNMCHKYKRLKSDEEIASAVRSFGKDL